MKKRFDIVKFFTNLFIEPKDKTDKRRLVIDKKTGKINWTKGEAPFGIGPDEEEIKAAAEEEEFKLTDDSRTGTRMFKPVPASHEPYRVNRFEINFPGIPPYFFQAYSYLGTDVHEEKKFFFSKKVIKDDFSSFQVLMLFPHEIDICEKLKELEENPHVGDVKVDLLDPTGVVVKTIVIPDCQVVEIKAFRDFAYGSYGDKSDTLLMGEIIVKHKQRKLI